MPMDGPLGLYSGGTPLLMPTCFAVLAAETATLSCLAKVRPERRDYILNCQSEEDGLFVPGTLLRRELTSHSATYLRYQATYFAIHALDALNSRPKYRISFARKLQDVEYVRGWLDGGPWQNPWLHSNNVMFALTFLQTDWEWFGEEASISAFDAILDYLDERQDPVSGLWQPDDGRDDLNAVYAAYHFFPYYFWRERQPAYVDRIIDTTLSIQQPGGLFGGGACEDLDAVHTLVMMSLVTEHRATEVRTALERCFWRLLQLQNSDGGFSYYVPGPQPRKSWKRRTAERLGLIDYVPQKFLWQPASKEWMYSGWKQLTCPCDESDLWASWFRPLSIRLIYDRYPDLAADYTPNGAYRSIPGLGWHDAERIRATINGGNPTTTAIRLGNPDIESASVS